MTIMKLVTIIIISLIAASCVSTFIPETDENTEAVVVDGLITDQSETDTIKLYKSIPLGSTAKPDPVEGCNVIISDDLGNSFTLSESKPGIYITNPGEFCGTTGRKYTLKIFTGGVTGKKYSYESVPMEMKPVPPIDSIWYEKITLSQGDQYHYPEEGCNIYLNTHDPANNCYYYRWNFTETWEMRIPYIVPHSVCWVSDKSENIMIKNTSVLSENRISRYPLTSLSNKTDRLNIKYSIIVNQYSLNEDEFMYWEKIQNLVEEVGSLYDITPASIPGNIYCVEDPNVKVLGYFSVSAKASRRIFIEDHFSDRADIYRHCPVDTVGEGDVLTGYWPIITLPMHLVVVTNDLECYDCTTRGTNIRPVFWDNR
jgi:hypothetical protein